MLLSSDLFSPCGGLRPPDPFQQAIKTKDGGLRQQAGRKGRVAKCCVFEFPPGAEYHDRSPEGKNRIDDLI
jgi:hypothetical protein